MKNPNNKHNGKKKIHLFICPIHVINTSESFTKREFYSIGMDHQTNKWKKLIQNKPDAIIMIIIVSVIIVNTHVIITLLLNHRSRNWIVSFALDIYKWRDWWWLCFSISIHQVDKINLNQNFSVQLSLKNDNFIDYVIGQYSLIHTASHKKKTELKSNWIQHCVKLVNLQFLIRKTIKWNCEEKTRIQNPKILIPNTTHWFSIN